MATAATGRLGVRGGSVAVVSTDTNPVLVTWRTAVVIIVGVSGTSTTSSSEGGVGVAPSMARWRAVV